MCLPADSYTITYRPVKEVIIMFGRKKRPERIECGGTTDKTDRSAPKTIASKEIVSFSAEFVLTGEWVLGERFLKCYFDIKPDENGDLTATYYEPSISFKADNELLTELQSIIDEQGLASKNGVYKVTAGLPPEYQPCYLNIVYASGERLSFTENNDPDAEWAKRIYLAFAYWFEKKGDSSLLPPDEKEPVTRISVRVVDNGIYTQYGRIVVLAENAINGERNLFGKNIWDSSVQKEVCDKYALFPEDYFDKVTAIINSYDLRAFDKCSVLYGIGRTPCDDDDDQTADVQIHITFASGHRLNINTSDHNDKTILKPLIDELFGYFDSLFETVDR